MYLSFCFPYVFGFFFLMMPFWEKKAITTKTRDSFSPLDSVSSRNLDKNHPPNLLTSSILCNNLVRLFAEPQKCVCVCGSLP